MNKKNLNIIKFQKDYRLPFEQEHTSTASFLFPIYLINPFPLNVK